jgi:hypothetical protein
MKTLWLFLSPNFVQIVLLLILAISTSLIVTGYEPTSKVSWLENRGIPFHFVTITGYEGPCPGKDLCRYINILSFDPWVLITDLTIWYLVSCTIIPVYEAVKKLLGQHLLEL